jgi:hypothetical protein
MGVEEVALAGCIPQVAPHTTSIGASTMLGGQLASIKRGHDAPPTQRG